MRDFINVGRVVKIHGIKGEVCIDFNADSLNLLEGGLFLKSRDGHEQPREYKIKSLRMHQGRPLVLLEGVSDRNAAELLRNLLVLVPRDRLPEAGEDEVYLDELPGLNVFLRQEDGSAVRLGLLDRVDTPAGQELWTIVTPEGNEILFPAVEEFVLSIDTDEGSVLIAPPPGLLDLYLQPARDSSKNAGNKPKQRKK